MGVPLSSSLSILEELTNRFFSSDFISDAEATFKYKNKMSQIKKSDVYGNLIWAMYHACREDKTNALSSFKNALHYSSNMRYKTLINMLFYMMRVGLLEDYINTLNEEEDFLKSSLSFTAWEHLANKYLLDGNFEKIQQLVDNINYQGTYYEESKSEIAVIKNKLYLARKFEEAVGISKHHIKKITDMMLSIANTYEFKDFNIVFSADDQKINTIIFYTSSSSDNEISNANLELSEDLVENEELLDYDFIPMFAYDEPKEILELV
ncbi:hypothetical protein [Wohlfahrtiimonas chitiniclastica]|uniref:hypothetical protein n=1 Tax=Wohlfahrtiimonas chitiniclastica TaxID=400946 RepID=UPI0011D04FA0|nr:hypothetical protein [Wohlfahrtiimonas chitiniclastica]